MLEFPLLFNMHAEYVHFQRLPRFCHKTAELAVNAAEVYVLGLNVVGHVAPVVPQIVAGYTGPGSGARPNHLTHYQIVQLYKQLSEIKDLLKC